MFLGELDASWHLQATQVCYGAKNKGYGYFTLDQTELLKGIMLEHISWFSTCNVNKPVAKGLWGCTYPESNEKLLDIMTVVTDGDDKLIFPADMLINSKGWKGFTVPGTNAQSYKALVYTDLASPKYYITKYYITKYY